MGNDHNYLTFYFQNNLFPILLGHKIIHHTIMINISLKVLLSNPACENPLQLKNDKYFNKLSIDLYRTNDMAILE